MCRLRDSLQALGGAGSIARRPVVRPPGVVAARRRESRSSPSPTPSTSARCVTPGSSASSTARSATASPAGWAQAATVLVVTSRSRSQSSSSRNSSRHVRVKRRHEGGDQRAGIEGRSPRSHPQVLTISQCRPCPLLSHRMPEVGESSPLCGEIRAVQVGRNRQHCRRLRPERSIATSVRNNVP